MANAATLEHPVPAQAGRAAPPVARLQAQLGAAPLHGWRFPAEFRLRPTGWTERGLARPAPSGTREQAGGTAPSSAGRDAALPLMLDPGPAGVTPDLSVSDTGMASNALGLAAAPALAYAAAMPIVRPICREPEQSAAIGQQAASALPALAVPEAPHGFTALPQDKACGCSNGTATAPRREIGVVPASGERAAAPKPFIALTAGDPGAWLRDHLADDAACRHATSYG